jgi:hypothetical protein
MTTSGPFQKHNRVSKTRYILEWGGKNVGYND